MAGDAARQMTVDPWVLEYKSYLPEEERVREALCTLGNGIWATRGAAPESSVGGFHYPGTYKAGVFDRLTTEISGRDIENESLVNLPNWLPLTFRIDGGRWFEIDDVELLEFRQALEMDHGILVRTMRFRDADGRETLLTQRRLVHMSRPDVAVLETTLRPENWSGTITFRSFLDGTVENRGVERYSDLASRHLEVLTTDHVDVETVQLRVRTLQSRIEVVETARTRVWVDGERAEASRAPLDLEGIVGQDIELDARQGSTLRVEKVVSLHTTGDRAISEPGLAGREAVAAAPDVAELVEEHMLAWDELWRRFHVDIGTEVRTRTIVHLHLFHLLVTTSSNTVEQDVGIPARGLHGEAYRGHIFWDELFVYPLLNVRLPSVARELLRYRYRRLPAARQLARDAGYDGAMFPWQSGSDGREESQVLHLNPKSGRWIPDESHRQRHINIAIAYNVWRYYTVTGDVEFLAEYGAELLIEIARFWASIASYDALSDRYHIVGVMGPDEFHDSDPNWDGHALRNNAYTNVMASWVLSVAPRALEPIPHLQRRELVDRLRLHREEMERWQDIARKLKVPMHDDGIISQFEGYEKLEEFDWDGYREEYGDIQRLDRILEAEDDTVNRYKASKQADVLMLLYLLSFEELQEVLGRLGVEFDSEMLNRNVEYYLARTSHGSTLSRVVHSWVLARTDRRRSMELFCEALESDIGDIQGGTTEEGIHLGAMAGSVDLALRGYSGLEFRYGVLHLKPSLPDEIEKLAFPIYYRRRWLTLEMANGSVHVTSERTSETPIQVECRGERKSLGSGETVTFARPRPVEEVEPEPIRLNRVAGA